MAGRKRSEWELDPPTVAGMVDELGVDDLRRRKRLSLETYSTTEGELTEEYRRLTPRQRAILRGFNTTEGRP